MDGVAFELIAHRGFSAARPENTIAAYTHALDQGFKHIETDCQLSKDVIPVVIHNELLEKTTNGTGRVCSHTADELRQLDAGSWFASGEYAGQRIPLLSEELKSEQPELPARVAEALVAAGWVSSLDIAEGLHNSNLKSMRANGRKDRVRMHLEDTPRHDEATLDRRQSKDDGPFCVPGLTITSFHLCQLKRSLQHLPLVRHAWLVQELDEGALATAAAAAAEARSSPLQLCPRANACTRGAVQAALARGHSVRGWGVRSLEDLDHLWECGAQGCTVNWPDVARQHITEKHGGMGDRH